MGDLSAKWSAISVAPNWGMGWFFTPELLKFSEGLPNDTSLFYGATATFHFKRVTDRVTEGEIGRVALNYFYLTGAKETLSNEDLPIADEVNDLKLPEPIGSKVNKALEFDWTRETTGHFVSLEYRFPFFPPLFRSDRWMFAEPRFGIGSGMAFLSTTVTKDRETEKSEEKALFGSGSMGLGLFEFRKGNWSMALDGSVLIVAGEIFALAGRGEARLQYNF